MTYDGIEIVANPLLAGTKKAIKSGNKLVVSPAMHSLLMSEKGEKLEALLKSLEFVDIGEPTKFHAMPLLTAPYSPLESLREFRVTLPGCWPPPAPR